MLQLLPRYVLSAIVKDWLEIASAVGLASAINDTWLGDVMKLSVIVSPHHLHSYQSKAFFLWIKKHSYSIKSLTVVVRLERNEIVFGVPFNCRSSQSASERCGDLFTDSQQAADELRDFVPLIKDMINFACLTEFCHPRTCYEQIENLVRIWVTSSGPEEMILTLKVRNFPSEFRLEIFRAKRLAKVRIFPAEGKVRIFPEGGMHLVPVNLLCDCVDIIELIDPYDDDMFSNRLVFPIHDWEAVIQKYREDLSPDMDVTANYLADQAQLLNTWKHYAAVTISARRGFPMIRCDKDAGLLHVKHCRNRDDININPLLAAYRGTLRKLCIDELFVNDSMLAVLSEVHGDTLQELVLTMVPITVDATVAAQFPNLASLSANWIQEFDAAVLLSSPWKQSLTTLTLPFFVLTQDLATAVLDTALRCVTVNDIAGSATPLLPALFAQLYTLRAGKQLQFEHADRAKPGVVHYSVVCNEAGLWLNHRAQCRQCLLQAKNCANLEVSLTFKVDSVYTADIEVEVSLLSSMTNITAVNLSGFRKNDDTLCFPILGALPNVRYVLFHNHYELDVSSKSITVFSDRGIRSAGLFHKHLFAKLETVSILCEERASWCRSDLSFPSAKRLKVDFRFRSLVPLPNGGRRAAAAAAAAEARNGESDEECCDVDEEDGDDGVYERECGARQSDALLDRLLLMLPHPAHITELTIRNCDTIPMKLARALPNVRKLALRVSEDMPQWCGEHRATLLYQLDRFQERCFANCQAMVNDLWDVLKSGFAQVRYAEIYGEHLDVAYVRRNKAALEYVVDKMMR